MPFSIRALKGRKKDTKDASEHERRESAVSDDGSVQSAHAVLPRTERSESLSAPTTGIPSRSSSTDKRKEPTGLHVLYSPDGEHNMDIIFVHGLGGSSQLSWSWKRDLDCFWPKEWLPMEPELEKARILTFGYNAFFMAQHQDMFNISGFSKQLLMQLKFGTSGSDALNIGKVPLMFVVHSMGGLVVKKALILGFADPEYRGILDSVCSIIFLATPHRGSGLAQILNKFLLVSFQAPKKYVSDLQRNSSGIEDINDQFRHHASRLQIVSFFETLPSSVGPKKITVVERDSAILGYFNEISAPLNANHAHVSKYPSPQDPNYTTVKNVIKSMVEKFRKKQQKPVRKASSSMLSQSSLQSTLETLLSMVEPRAELESLLELYVEGTSDWILDDPSVQRWLDFEGKGPTILHVTGHPGSGKSVLASFLVSYLEDACMNVQFFFFRFDSQQTGKSVRHCLLSLAYQLAISYPAYGRRLKAILESRRSLSNADARRLWQKVFMGIFSKLEDMEPIYWVIDALDESDSVQLLLNLLPSLQTGELPVRILFLTRPHTVGRAFDKLRLNLPAEAFSSISMATPQSGLVHYISQELQFTKWPGDPEFMHFITQSLLDKCRGNFLWLRLVLKELANCDYQHEALHALEETPPELAAVYQRIQAQLVKQMRPDSLDLAVRILSWITCSDRQLTLEELAEGLKTHRHADPMLHPQQTIDRLCGDLVVVGKNQNISMVHHTAKEFLTQTPDSPLHIDTTQAHSLILERCLNQLTDPKVRLRVKTEGCRGFLQYACSSWSHHLAQSNVEDTDMISSLSSFLQSGAVLSWIDAACQLGKLRILTTAAKNINTFRERRLRFNSETSPNTHCEEGMEAMEQWSSDLVRVVGKFGNQLILHPAAIYTLVPALCPPESAISSHFLSSSDPTFMVSGLENRSWDDSIASFSVGYDCQPTSISALEDHFAVHSHDDTITLYSSSVFQKLRQFRHEEVIVAFSFSQDGDKLVTCGPRTIKLWDVSTGRLLDYYPNPQNTRAVSVALNREAKKVILCCIDGKIRSQELGSPENRQVILREVSADDSLGSASGTPCAVSFSPDATKLAMAFRGRLLGLWSAETGRLIGRCRRRSEGAFPTSANQMRPYPQRLMWNPIHEHVLGIYNDGTLFKWNPVDVYAEELDTPIEAHEVACSPDGRFVVTASGGGSLHVWHYDTMRLIYHLSCASPVTSMSVSADARRIYDLRESFCNVWQPNSLIRLAESDEKASETSSQHAESFQISLTSEFRAAIPDPVTALAVGTNGSAYCFANDNGELTLQPSASGEPIKVDSRYIGATCLAFSQDDTMIACAELEGSVTIRRAQAGHPEPLSDLIQINPGSLVQQLLFSKGGSDLVIKSAENLSLWDTVTGSIVASRSLGEEDYRVALHPLDGNCLISISASTISLLSLTDLSAMGSWELDRRGLANKPPNVAPNSSKRPFSKHNTGRSDTQSVVGEISVCEGQPRVFVEIINQAADGGGACDIDFFLVDLTAPSSKESSTDPGSVEAEPLPPEVLRRIEISLGFLNEDGVSRSKAAADRYSLAFVDVDFWVCTWSLSGSGGGRLKRHFFLPNDWINLDCLDMATVTGDGRFLCPRNGEVAMISGAFNNAWLE